MNFVNSMVKMDDKLIKVLSDLENDFRERRRLRMLRACSQTLAVISSSLLKRCLEVKKLLKKSNSLDALEKFLAKHVIPRTSCGLPPYTTKLLITKLEQIYPRLNPHDVYTVQLPENHPSYDQRRAGIILRQHIYQGQIKALFVAGTELNSPANRALNLHCGDRVLAVSGVPINWRTLELYRFGLLDVDEFRGLQYNANLYDLACHLLDEPYRLDRQGSGSKDIKTKPLLVLVNRQKYELKSENVSSCDPALQSSNLIQCKASKDACELVYRETVLNATNPNSGLGLQLGFDETTNGVYIVSILPNSEATMDGILKEGDRIIEVNYENIENMDSREALKKIKTICQKTSFVHLKIARPVHDLDEPTEHTTQDPIHRPHRDDGAGSAVIEHQTAANDHEGTEKPTDVTLFDTEREVVLHDEVLTDPLISSINLEEKYAYQLAYWRDQFAPTVELLVVEYDISQSTCGLGISLEGTMEQEEGESTPLPHHYIVDLIPQSPIHRQGILKPEDELLEVNENILYGEDHLKVARIMHSIRPQGYLICARYHTPQVISDPPDKLDQNDAVMDDQTSQMDSQPFHKTKESVGTVQEIGSDSSSDVDRNPMPARVIFARSIRQTDNEEDRSVEELTSVTLPIDAELATGKGEAYDTELSTDGRDVKQTGDHADTVEMIDHSRLPMPARLASLVDEVTHHSEYTHRRSMPEIMLRTEHSPKRPHSSEITFQTEKNCLAVNVTKSYGEFLGLEIESDDGGPNGISLLSIIADSPLDRFRTGIQATPSWNSYSSVHQYWNLSSRESSLPLIKPGDWIVSVAGYSFRNRLNFKARRLLRRLVVSSGTFEIEYIPAEWILDTGEDSSLPSNAKFHEVRRDDKAESDYSDL